MLIPAVAEEITIIRLLVNLLKAVFGGNIIANAAVLLPVRHSSLPSAFVPSAFVPKASSHMTAYI